LLKIHSIRTGKKSDTISRIAKARRIGPEPASKGFKTPRTIPWRISGWVIDPISLAFEAIRAGNPPTDRKYV
jgi:hypothetical protein